MPSTPRSYCPINLSLEIFGDAWTLLVLRDMMFSGKRHFRELLKSDERISSNILADRLTRLVEHGLLTKSDDPTHKQKAIYSLTEKAIALLPIVVQIGAWGSRWVPDAKKLDVKGADGKTLSLVVDASTKVARGTTVIKAADLKAGERVVAAYMPMKGPDGAEMLMAKDVKAAAPAK